MISARRSLLALLLLLGTLLAVSEGCVRRRITVRSDPPGAVAYLDNVELGKTPISRNFDFYGKRELRLVKDGYETHTELVALPAPWYEWAGIDFVSEILVPGVITNQHYFDVRMRSQQMIPPDDLIMQAEQLRATAHASGAFRAGSSTPYTPTPYTPAPYAPTPYGPVPSIPGSSAPSMTPAPTPNPQYAPETSPNSVVPYNPYPENPQNQPGPQIQQFPTQPTQQFPPQRLQVPTPTLAPNQQNP
ncbi:MAG: PEGA domain-containing protein [Thermoguttaceae bacterium]